MTFGTLVNTVTSRMTMATADGLVRTRIAETINEKYKEVLSRCGQVYATRTTQTAVATVGNRYLTFSNVTKVTAVFENSGQILSSLTSVGTTATGTTSVGHGYQVGSTITITGATPTAYNGFYAVTAVPTPTTFTYTFAGGTSPATGTLIVGLSNPNRILDERTFDQLRDQLIGAEPPQQYAISTVTDSSVTIFLDCFPTSAFVLTADAFSTTSDLAGSDRPLIIENFQNMLIYAAMEVEYDKLDNPLMARRMGEKFEKRLAEYQYFLSISGRRHMMQGMDFLDWAARIAL